MDGQVQQENQATEGPTSSTAKRKAEWFDIDEKDNFHVYVSGLPKTMTEEEFVDLMKIAGIIAKKNVHGSPYNIKMYKDKESGTFKGDALCRYVRKESVQQAVLLIDGRQYDADHILHCEPAKFQLKGSYDPSKKPRVDPKAKLKQKKVADKILSWEPPKEPLELRQKKVIVKHMFTPEEILEDPGLLIELKDDVEAICADIAEPKRVDIYDKHPDGVIGVTFAEPEQATAFLDALLKIKYYAGRVLEVELWDGKTNYKIKETDEESEKRFEKWTQDIQKSGDNDETHVENKDVTTESREEEGEGEVTSQPSDSSVTKIYDKEIT